MDPCPSTSQVPQVRADSAATRSVVHNLGHTHRRVTPTMFNHTLDQ